MSELKEKQLAGRVSTLKRKAEELSVLCGVSTTVICYAPDGGLHLWPENPHEVRRLVEGYRNLSEERGKKNKKTVLQLSEWDERLDGFSPEALTALLPQLDSKVAQLQAKVRSEEANRSESTNLCLSGIVSDNVNFPLGRSFQTEEIEVAQNNEH